MLSPAVYKSVLIWLYNEVLQSAECKSIAIACILKCYHWVCNSITMAFMLKCYHCLYV